MVQGTINRQIIIDYLLGTIPEEDLFTLAERFSTDEELFDQLKAVEADLVDQYVCGRLGPEDARRLEGYLYHLPDGRHKIGVARALMKMAAEKQPAAAVELQPNAWWRLIFLPARRPRLRSVYSLVVVLIALVIAVVWLANHNRQLRRQNERLFAQAEQHKIERDRLEQKIASEQKQSDEQQPQPVKSQQDSGSRGVEAPPNQAHVQWIARASKLVKLRLTPSQRISSKPDTLVLDPNVRLVSLIAPIEGREKYTGYRARLRAAEGEGNVILEKQAFHSPGKSIVIRVAASQLPPATYRLILELRTAAAVDMYDYVFTIVKRQAP